MRFDRSGPGPRDEERILPLINVVFLLLIFFMLAGQLSAVDPIVVEPPRSAGTGAVDPRDLVILLGPDGALAVDGTAIAADDLASALATALAGDTARSVWLKADGGAEALEAIAVMEALRSAGLDRLQLLTAPLDEAAPW